MLSALKNRKLIVVLGGALALRIAIAFAVTHHVENAGRQFLIEGDANGYWALANRLAAGESFEVHQPPRRVMRMPGFPAVLAVGITLFGENLLAARLLLAVVGMAACGLTWWLSRALFGDRIALWSTVFCAVSPALAGFSVLVLSETLFAACLILSLIAMHQTLTMLKAEQPLSRRLRTGALTGAAVALACYVRPSWLLASPAFGLLCVGAASNRVHGLLTAMSLGVATIGCLIPWMIRNQRAVGHPVLTTLWAGPSLYDGLNPDATGDSNMEFIERDALYRVGVPDYEFEANRIYSERAVAFARENPGRTVSLAFSKLRRFWNPVPNAAQLRGTGPGLACLVSFLPLVGFAVYGAWLCRDQPSLVLLTIGPVLYFSTIHMIFVGSIRYRLPAEYPLCALAAFGFCHLSQMNRG